MLEPGVVGERVCITQPKGVSDEYFYFYSGVTKDLKIRIPFNAFESDLLQTLNIGPSKLRPNGWGLIKAFELICEMVSITPTLGLFFLSLNKRGKIKEVGSPLVESQGKDSFRPILPTIKVSRINSFE